MHERYRCMPTHASHRSTCMCALEVILTLFLLLFLLFFLLLFVHITHIFVAEECQVRRRIEELRQWRSQGIRTIAEVHTLILARMHICIRHSLTYTIIMCGGQSFVHTHARTYSRSFKRIHLHIHIYSHSDVRLTHNHKHAHAQTYTEGNDRLTMVPVFSSSYFVRA